MGVDEWINVFSPDRTAVACTVAAYFHENGSRRARGRMERADVLFLPPPRCSRVACVASLYTSFLQQRVTLSPSLLSSRCVFDSNQTDGFYSLHVLRAMPCHLCVALQNVRS